MDTIQWDKTKSHINLKYQLENHRIKSAYHCGDFIVSSKFFSMKIT